MNMIKEIEQQYKRGLPVLEKFMALTDKEIKDKVRSIVADDKYDSLLDDSSQITRVIRNEKPSEISIEFYDWIKITVRGIEFHQEIGGGGLELVKFTDHFKF